MKLWFGDREEGAAAPFLSLRPKQFFTSEELGPKQALTPDGFLLCSDTPIARVGQQVYGEHELPGMRGKDGIITIQRDAEEVFRPDTIASFNGKPVTNNHPPEKVVPANFKLYAVGTVLNPHRGDGIETDANFLYADLLITDPQAIGDIRTGKREVSAGYDAEYKQLGDGLGVQHSIVGNHVALVNRGRCGPLCSIGDEDMPRVSVHDSRRKTFRDRLLASFHSRDESAFHDQLEELAKVPELLGEQVSGEGSGGDGRTGDTHVSINLGGGGGAPSVSSGSGPVVGDQPDPAEGPDPSAGGGGDMMQQILQRLDRIEQAIVVLAQGESAEQDPMAAEEDRTLGDRRTSDRKTTDKRTRDQDPPSAPPTEEPEEDPAESLPYGAGTTNIEFEAPQLGTGDKRRTTGDKAFVGDSTSMRAEFQDTLSRAELLVPNVRLPTFDARTSAKTTFDTLCGLRRNVLQEAYRNGEKRTYVDTVLGKPAGTADFTKMTCDAVAMVFNGASELARQANNASFGRVRPNNENVRGAGGTLTPAEINARNRAKWNIN